MRGDLIRNLYLTEQEAHVLSNFFITVTNLADEDKKLDMTELLGLISSDSKVYDKYGQIIQIHYDD
jgi:hypothetical protein